MDTALERELNTLEDPEGRLQKVAERLLAQLPPSQIHYRFVIVDSPELNSFGLAGGRIYIFRRGKVFGHVVAVSSSGGKLLVENDRGVADLL